jgi:hypothetical protein
MVTLDLVWKALLEPAYRQKPNIKESVYCQLQVKIMVGVGCARDIVRAAAAYCTRGDGKFNPKYFPGADLDPSDLCHIGLFDLVVISGKFAKTFGMPSDSAHV